MSSGIDRHALLLRARDLRQESTAAEEALWERLRDRRFRGLKFRRQVTLQGYIADFFCDRLRLVVEVDGGIHATRPRRARDENRDADLLAHGYTVLRFTNREVLAAPETVLARLAEGLKERG
jgi:type I restriction enzyme, R subunit